MPALTWDQVLSVAKLPQKELVYLPLWQTGRMKKQLTVAKPDGTIAKGDTIDIDINAPIDLDMLTKERVEQLCWKRRGGLLRTGRYACLSVSKKEALKQAEETMQNVQYDAAHGYDSSGLAKLANAVLSLKSSQTLPSVAVSVPSPSNFLKTDKIASNKGLVSTHPTYSNDSLSPSLGFKPTASKRPPSPSLQQNNTITDLSVLAQSVKRVPKVSKQKERDPVLHAPPSAAKQWIRYAGTCQPLKIYLTRLRLWKRQGGAHWDAIGDWMKTKEGCEWLRECGLDPNSVHRDHIHDKNHTPVHHALNCYFMPGGTNSHFRDRLSEEKMKYIGEQASAISTAFIKWYIESANALSIDCSKFDATKVLAR